MPDPGTDQVTVALILIVVALAIATFFETRFLRKRMKNRRLRRAKRDDDLPDDAHNAIITTKAILSSLERQGIRSEEAAVWLREAQLAQGRRNYRVVMELTGKARDRLLTLKAAQASKGDLAKLDQLSNVGAAEEMTTKEVLLQKEVPPNLLQSKFSIDVAGAAVEQGRMAGRDVGQATELLEAAKARFEAKDYAGAFSIARQSKRAADGEAVERPVPAPAVITEATAVGRPCPSCGSDLRSEDVFCRKCGTRLTPSACGSCGASILPDDAFCRKCGTPVSR